MLKQSLYENPPLPPFVKGGQRGFLCSIGSPIHHSGYFPLRLAILGTILLFFLGTQISFAENPLLRGPQKAVPSRAEAPAPGDGKPGLLEKIAAAPVLFYQRFLSPHLGRRCAYHPSCSNYALLAIRKHGALLGSVMTCDRLQHEADEARYSPLILIDRQKKLYDPPENNDFWWHTEPKGPDHRPR